MSPILFNAFLNDYFCCIKQASVHNFADDNTFSSFPKTSVELTGILTLDCNNVIKCSTKCFRKTENFSRVYQGFNQYFDF